MNIGSFQTTYSSSLSELRTVQTNPLGSNVISSVSSSDATLTERPVLAVDKLERSSLPAGGSSSDTTLDDDANINTNEANNNLDEQRDKKKLEQEQDLISQLAARDREVRAHEQAHAAVGGQYAGAPQYEFQRGPDGVRYAVGGEVSIDVSKAATPQETINKMQIVRRAALAPAEPSPQDRSVAAQASSNEAQARRDLAIESREQAEAQKAESAEARNSSDANTDTSASAEENGASNESAAIALERSAAFIPFRPSLPPSAINNQLRLSILASRDLSGPGALFDQHA